MNWLLSASRVSRQLFCLAFCCIFTMSAALTLAACKPSEIDRNTVARNFNLLPLRFEPNQGQSSSGAGFLAQGRGFSALFKENEADLLLAHRTGTDDLLRVTLARASQNASISAESRLPGTVNYFDGSEPKNWHTGLPTFERLRYASIYPGIDLIYYGSQGRLEFDFELSPGAVPSQIQMRFEGARSLRVDGKGDLIVTANDGHVSFQRPVIYQPAEGGGKDLVAGHFKVLKKDTVSFAVAGYDRARPLVIDPILNYSLGRLPKRRQLPWIGTGRPTLLVLRTWNFPLRRAATSQSASNPAVSGRNVVARSWQSSTAPGQPCSTPHF